MRKHSLTSYVLRLPYLVAAVGLFLALVISGTAYATGASGNNCTTFAGSGASGASPDACDTCMSAAIFQSPNSGPQILSAIFTAINNTVNTVEQSFFNGIVNGSGFQAAIGSAVVLYIAMYGILIFFGIGSFRTYEVIGRLTKVGIVYMMVGSPTAWTNFQTWIATPFLGGMNQLIQEFTVSSESGSGTTVQLSSGLLDVTMFSGMFGGTITQIFSTQYFTAIMGVAATGFFGWLIALFMAWSVLEFGMMLLGALITYATCLIGLAFLFGIAPFFFVFILFKQTQNIFWGWFNMVLGLSLQPVLLFAFLSFYLALIGHAANNLLTDSQGNVTDFCWDKWFSMPGSLWDIYMMRPTVNGAPHPGQYTDANGNTLAEPIGVVNLLYFAIVCHLGNAFSTAIESICGDITGGNFGSPAINDTVMSGGITTTGDNVKNSAVNAVKAVSRTVSSPRSRGP